MNTELAHRQESAPVVQRQSTAVTPGEMLQIAIERGADLDKLEKLMELQERWYAAEAKKLYDAAFAAFKAEAVTIVKGRHVNDGPLKGKRYAELSDIVSAVTPALSKHGLSSSWRLTKDEPTWMEVTCYLRHVGGHEESASMGGPPDTGGAKNAIQARASTKTYLERYTLKAITGLSEQGDDSDGNGARTDNQKFITSAQAKRLRDAAKFVGKDDAYICKKAQVEAVEDLHAARFQGALKHLQGLAEANQ